MYLAFESVDEIPPEGFLYSGLYGETPAERGAFFALAVP